MKQNKQIDNRTFHTNRILAAIIIAIAYQLVQIMINKGLTNTGTILIALKASLILSFLFLAAAVFFLIIAIMKDRSYLEYTVFAALLAVGYYIIHGVPVVHVGNWTLFNSRHWEYIVLAFNLLYLVISLWYHTVAGRSKKHSRRHTK